MDAGLLGRKVVHEIKPLAKLTVANSQAHLTFCWHTVIACRLNLLSGYATHQVSLTMILLMIYGCRTLHAPLRTRDECLFFPFTSITCHHISPERCKANEIVVILMRLCQCYFLMARSNTIFFFNCIIIVYNKSKQILVPINLNCQDYDSY